jgi:integrase
VRLSSEPPRLGTGTHGHKVGTTQSAPRAVVAAEGLTPEVSPMRSEPTQVKRERHVPVAKANHIYWSRRADGTKVFEVRHPTPSRQYEVVGPRLDQAKARAREVHGGNAPAVVKVGMTVKELLARYRETRQVGEDEDRILRLHIEPRWNRVKLRDITWSDVAVWWPSLKRADGRPGELAEGTKALIVARFSVLLEYAIEIGALGVNPVKQLPTKRRPRLSEPRRRILTFLEEQLLLAYCARSPWIADVIAVALSQALRLGEVLGLQWEDIDFQENKLRVRHSLGRDGTPGPTKHTQLTGKRDPRDLNPIDLMPAARELLLGLRMDSDGTGFVFRNRLGGARRRRDVQRAFSKAVKRAALPTTADGPVTFHALRHTAISRLANDPRVGVVYARDFAGHASLKTTDGYVHRVESAARTSAAAEALSGEVAL